MMTCGLTSALSAILRPMLLTVAGMLYRKRYEWPTGISVDICRVPRPVGFRTSALSAAA